MKSNESNCFLLRFVKSNAIPPTLSKMGITAEMQYRQGIYARLKKLEEHIFTPPPTAPPPTEEKDLAEPTAPPPTAEAFVFTAPGTLREIVSQQNTVMKDLADQVARQSITLKEMQAKMDAQEQAQNENNEKKRGQIIRLWEEQKELQAKMDAQELAHNDEMDAQAQAQNAKIATLSAQVVDVNRRWMQSCDKIHAQKQKIATLSAEVAHQKTDIKHYQAKLDVLSDRIHAIEHGSQTLNDPPAKLSALQSFRQTLNDPTAKLSAEVIDIADQFVRQSTSLNKIFPDGPASSAKPALP